MKNFAALKAQRFFALSFDALFFPYGGATGTPKGALKDFACGLGPSVFTAKICRLRGVQFFSGAESAFLAVVYARYF